MIQFFVSSTFNDMQAERDVIHQIVEPRVRREAAKYGESVRLVDLRWGVNTQGQTEEESSEKVVEVCLHEIDACDGYMVVMLGKRYGWVPDYRKLSGMEVYGVDPDDPISVTELEIKHGIFDRGNADRAVIFFRDEVKGLTDGMRSIYEDEVPDARLEAVKNRLTSLSGDSVSHYDLTYDAEANAFEGVNEFADLLEQRLCDKIREICEEKQAQSVTQQQANLFSAFVQNQGFHYRPIPVLEEAMDDFLASNIPVFLLKGTEGMGKTAFCSWFCKIAEERMVIPYFSQVSDHHSAEEILRYFSNRLCELLGEQMDMPDTVSGMRFYFGDLIERVGKKLYFVVDSIDDLEEEEALEFLPLLLDASQAQFILTANGSQVSVLNLKNFGLLKEVYIPEIEDMGAFVGDVLASMGKELPREVLQTALEGKGNGNYLYGELAVRLLGMIDRHDFQKMNQGGGDIDSINRYISNMLDEYPPSLEAMGLYFLYMSMQKLAPELGQQLIQVNAACPGGLRAQDYQSLLSECWVETDFQRLENFLEGIFQQNEDGCYRFVYEPLVHASSVLLEENTKKKVFEYLYQLPQDDPIKKRRFPLMGLEEKKYQEVSDLILSDDAFDGFVKQMSGSMSVYWRQLPAMFKNQEFLRWFLENVSPKLKSQDDKTRLHQALENTIAPEDSYVACLFYENMAAYQNERRLYERALDHALQTGELLRIARMHLLVAKSIQVATDSDYEQIKEHIQRARDISEPFVHNHDGFCLFMESDAWNHILKAESMFKKINHTSIHSMAADDDHPDYLDLMANFLCFPHSFVERNEDFENMFICLSQNLMRMQDMIGEDLSAVTRRRLYELIERFSTYLCRTQKGEEVETVLERQIQVLRKRLFANAEWDAMELTAMTYYYLANHYEYSGDEKRLDALESAVKIWTELYVPGMVNTHAECIVGSLKSLCDLYLDQMDSPEVVQKRDETLEWYVKIKTDQLEEQLRHAHQEAKEYPDEKHMDALDAARHSLWELKKEYRCMKHIPQAYKWLQTWESAFVMFRYSSMGQSVSDIELGNLGNVLDHLFILVMNAAKEQEDSGENRDIELTYLYLNTYKVLLLFDRKLDEESNTLLLHEVEHIKAKITLLENLLPLAQDDTWMRIGVLGNLIQLYMKYGIAADLSEEAMANNEAKRQLLIRLLKEEEHLKNSPYHDRMFGTITRDMFD